MKVKNVFITVHLQDSKNSIFLDESSALAVQCVLHEREKKINIKMAFKKRLLLKRKMSVSDLL